MLPWCSPYERCTHIEPHKLVGLLTNFCKVFVTWPELFPWQAPGYQRFAIVEARICTLYCRLPPQVYHHSAALGRSWSWIMDGRHQHILLPLLNNSMEFSILFFASGASMMCYVAWSFSFSLFQERKSTRKVWQYRAAFWSWPLSPLAVAASCFYSLFAPEVSFWIKCICQIKYSWFLIQSRTLISRQYALIGDTTNHEEYYNWAAQFEHQPLDL